MREPISCNQRPSEAILGKHSVSPATSRNHAADAKWRRGGSVSMPPPTSNALSESSAAALAIAFCNSRPFVASTVIGATSTEQLEINLQGFGVEWTDELEAEIARIHNYYPDPWRMLVRGGG